MIIINLRLTLLFILATFTYSVQSDEFDDQTTYTQYRYFSTAIPEDIRRFMFYVDYCFVDLAFDIETDSMTAKNDIINECTPLKERNKTLKEKYKKNEEIIAILSIADDTILIYEELKKITHMQYTGNIYYNFIKTIIFTL